MVKRRTLTSAFGARRYISLHMEDPTAFRRRVQQATETSGEKKTMAYHGKSARVSERAHQVLAG
jgi:hypothetical protein